MEVILAGKQRIAGKDKNTGASYDYIVVHYLAQAVGVVGQAALTDNLSPAHFAFDKLAVGSKYIVEHDRKGKLLEFSIVE